MKFIAKNNISISENKPDDWSHDSIIQLLTKRLIINGFECEQLIKFKPIDTDLDVLFVRYDQMLDGLLVQISNEMGKHVSPEITKETRDSDVITPRNAINFCIRAHGFDVKHWSDGAFIVTNRRSALLPNLYANETAWTNAKQEGAVVTELKEKACVYCDPDIYKRFLSHSKSVPDSKVTVVGDSKTCLNQMYECAVNLNKAAETIRNQDAKGVLLLTEKISEESEKLKQLFMVMSIKVEREDVETEENTIHLEERIKALRKSKERMIDEMEEQLVKQEETIAVLSEQITKLKGYRKTKIEREADQEDLKEIELNERIQSLSKKTVDLQQSVSTMDVAKMFPVTDVATDVVAIISTKEVSSIMPKWQTQDNINGYCKRIEAAWSFCHAEDSNFQESKFCQILRLGLPTNCGEIFDNMNEDDKNKVNTVVTTLKEKLDKQSGEYLHMFSQATKLTGETHNQFAIRIQRLYKFGTGDSAFTERDQKLMVEAFVKGLPLNESTALRLVASDQEMKDVDMLAKRASRSAQTQQDFSVNAVPISNRTTEDSFTLPNKQQLKGWRFKGQCHYCKKSGHMWRRCFKRANENPEWKPEAKTEKAKQA